MSEFREVRTRRVGDEVVEEVVETPPVADQVVRTTRTSTDPLAPSRLNTKCSSVGPPAARTVPSNSTTSAPGKRSDVFSAGVFAPVGVWSTRSSLVDAEPRTLNCWRPVASASLRSRNASGTEGSFPAFASSRVTSRRKEREASRPAAISAHFRSTDA